MKVISVVVILFNLLILFVSFNSMFTKESVLDRVVSFIAVVGSILTIIICISVLGFI